MRAYWDAIRVLLSDAFSFGLALFEGVFVLEFGAHGDDCWRSWLMRWERCNSVGSCAVCTEE